MNKSELKYYNFVFVVFLWSAFSACKLSFDSARPNVILIMTDDQGWGDLCHRGNDSIYTPYLDQLAQNGVRFNNFYVSPVCAPTRASLLTGNYHLRTGTSWVTHRKEVMRADEITIAEIFGEAGYKTGIFGKWHNGKQFPNDPIGQGFNEFLGFTEGHLNTYFDPDLIHNKNEIKTKGFISDILTDAAIAFIKKCHIQKNPFLCYIPYNAPHSPFQVPDNYFDKYKSLGLTDKNAAIYGMIENIDKNIGKILSTLEDEKIKQNTIVLFLSDNGPNGHRYNGNLRGIKGSVYDGGIKSPLIMSWEGKIPKNKLVNELAAHIDILPTLIDLCQIDIQKKKKMDGRSLKNILLHNDPIKKRELFFIHTEGSKRMYPSAVNNGQFKLVYNRKKEKELYDLNGDPEESNNIFNENPDQANKMFQNLYNWFSEVSVNAFQTPPIPVVIQVDERAILPGQEATLSGPLQFAGKRGWANDYVINWNSNEATLSWDIDIHIPGSYRIEMSYNANQLFLNNQLELQIGNETQPFYLKDKFDGYIEEKNDRVVRGEVYEKSWKMHPVAIVDFDKGLNTLTISLKSTPAEGAEFKLKEIHLVRIS